MDTGVSSRLDLRHCAWSNIRDYTFFSYRPEEALHVSLREKQVILELLDKINEELQRCIDCYSQKIISKYIELLLDYCEQLLRTPVYHTQ